MNKNIILIAMIAVLGLLTFNGCEKCTRFDMTTTPKNMVLVPAKSDPTISFNIWFKVGSQNDPAGKEGLALLTASMLTEGATKQHSYESILEKLYPMSAGYGSKVDKEMTTITGRTHIDNINEYYTLLMNSILSPAFNEDDFQRNKSQMLNYLEKDLRYSSDEELGKSALYSFVFEGTPYAHNTVGTVEALKAITIQDVKEFYAKYYTKDNVVVGLGGGYEQNLIEKLQTDIAKLPATEVTPVPKPIPAKIDGLEVFMVDKQCDATAISFGFPINVLRGDEDFFALALFNSWFGEHRNSSSHLYQVIREQRGMNYGDYSYIETFPNGGRLNMPSPNNSRRQQIFEVWLRPVRNEHRHFALRAAMRELKSVIDNGMDKESFELTKKFLYKYAQHFAPTTFDQLGYAIDSKFYGIESQGDYIQNYRQKIKAMTLEQVNAAIKKHLQYNNIKIAIVTQNARTFMKELTENTPSPITYDTPKGQAVLDEDKIISVFPLKVLPEKVRIVEVEEMFAK